MRGVVYLSVFIVLYRYASTDISKVAINALELLSQPIVFLFF